MRLIRPRMLARVAALSFVAATAASAQGRLVLPEGSVILVQTNTALESNTARQGQTFETTVTEMVTLDNYSVIPEGSRIRGVITFVRPATRSEPGVIEVNFDRLTLADGTSYVIDGRLTSTDANERRQIDADPNARVVLVGGRGIAGAGSENSPASSILAALGGLLGGGSSVQDVRLRAGTPLAVQLDQQVVLRGRGARRNADAFTIYTDTDMIRAAQQALAQQNLYRGPINGRLDDATRRALFDFQVARGMVATGNLNGRTAQALGLSTTGTVGGGFGGVMTTGDASLLQRGAAALVTRYRQDVGISTAGTINNNRSYSEGDVELMFALSAFSDNSDLYDQLVRTSRNQQALVTAGRALLNAARRVDTAMQQGRPSYQVTNAWNAIRNQLSRLDTTYR